MFQHSANTSTRVTAVMSLLIAAAVVGMGSAALAGDPGWSIEGTWITTMVTPAGRITLTQTITPLDPIYSTFTSVMEQVNQNPTYFGAFPEADAATRWAGSIAQVDPATYEGTFVSYLTKVAEHGAGSHPPAETVAILVLSGEWELTGPDAWNGEVSIAAYRADQDADQDGLVDDGQSPLDCSVYTHTGKRLGLMPPCTPKPPSETIDVVVGQSFVISLESNPSTGYSWAMAGPLPAWLELIGSEFKPWSTEPGVVGSGGIEEWTFKANDAGTVTITFEYRRPWEKNQPPAQRKTFVIVARPAGDSIDVSVGQDFTISLGANHSTGYMWELADPLPAWLDQVDCVYEPVQTDPPCIGCPGVEKWTFRANAAGSAAITFEYRQPWMPDEPHAQRKTFTIVARP